jgi:hypothetical protein
MKKIISILFMLGFLPQFTHGQDSTAGKLTLDGYVSFMESAMDLNIPGEGLLWESLLHNRINLNYYPSNAFSFSLQIRNRFIAGERLRQDEAGAYASSLAKDMGVVDLSWNPVTCNSCVFNTAIDRLWMKYSRDRLEITAGRQRINWGQTYVWNPNDWFNNYSFFDVDYLERPGSDAFRIQYYTGSLSGLEAVVKVDSTHRYTVAGMFKTNFRGYDLQLLAGDLAGEDLAFGLGWAGGLRQIGFKGELSYLHPLDGMADTTGLFFVSLALDYTFSNSLMIQVEAFYNQLPRGTDHENFTEYYTRPLSVKDLSFTEYNLFAQVTYPFVPLMSGSLAAIWFPDADGYYLGPALTWSLMNNLDLSLILQYFSGKFSSGSGGSERQHFTLGFGRIKYNF